MPKRIDFGNNSIPAKPVEQAPAPRKIQLSTTMPAKQNNPQINTYPKPLQMNGTLAPPKPAVASAPKVMGFGGKPASDLDPLIAEAKNLDPLIDKNPMFMPRLRACVELTPLQWMNWANDRMDILRDSAKVQVDVNIEFNDLKAAQWVDDAREHASKKPGLFDGFKARIDPDWYDAQLVRVRGELNSLAERVQKARDALRPKMLNLMLDNIIFQAVTKHHTDPAANQIAHGKIQTMLSSVQMGQMAEQSLQSLLTTITSTIQAIDTVRSNVIPAWRIANSKR